MEGKITEVQKRLRIQLYWIKGDKFFHISVIGRKIFVQNRLYLLVWYDTIVADNSSAAEP